ncbi:hypothetical protein Sango_2741900 [Sesamum angolense]|uniref:Retrotransposon gag domain-containing protein n=1 Tax=Sesamum angolense TaxID=2727404 RepID=A0AAE1T950_9LAMI|nr:hypothetical protein Sango_2741900 [Sesamum angolense]
MAPIMITNATTIKEQLESLTRAIEGLTKHVQEQDAQIAKLINKADNIDTRHITGKQGEAHDEAEAINHQSFNNLMARTTLSNTWLISLKRATMREQLEQEFLNRFYSTRRTVSMVELTNSRQWKEEPVVDYINRWRNLSLNCKDRLSEPSAIEICNQDMHWGLRYIFQGILPKSFKKLTTGAHDMELSITSSGVEGPLVQKPVEPRKNKN